MMSDDLIRRSDVYKAVDDWLEGRVPNLNIKDIPSADRPQEWIPCSERLPDDDDRVLTYDTDGDINIMWFDGRDEDGKDVWKDDYSIEWCDIVAWQPLPEPWEGADDE